MLKNTTALTVAILVATPLAAQELTYATGSFEFERFGDGDVELDISDLVAEGEYTIDQFVLGASVKNRNLSGNDGPSDLSVTTLRATVAYMVTPEVLVGAGVSNLSFDFDGFGPTQDASGFEVFGQYETEQFAVAARYQKPDSDDDDFTWTLLAGEFAATPELTVSTVLETPNDEDTAYHVAADFDAGQYFVRGYYASVQNTEEGILGASGGYRFNDQITLNAGFQTAVGDDDFDYSRYSIGGSYEIMDGVLASASYEAFSGEDDLSDVSGLTLAVSYTLGASKRVDTRLFEAARDDLSGGLFAYNPYTDFGLTGFGFGFGI